MKCTKCSNEISGNSKFCKYCGAPVRKLAEKKENNKNALKNPLAKEIIKQKKSQNKIPGIIWNAAVLLLAGLLLIISGLNFISATGAYKNGIAADGAIQDKQDDTELVSAKAPGEEPEAGQEEVSGEESGIGPEQFDVSQEASGEEPSDALDSADEEALPDHTISLQTDAGTDIDASWNSPETAQANESGLPEYILVDSDRRYISEEELDNLTREQLKIARNELYARHGRKFEDEGLTKYFSQFEWYYPMIEPDDFEESMLNVYEIANRDMIVRYEREHGYRT